MRQWRGFFTRLERLYGLMHKEPSHLWLLNELFLPLINEDCRKFRKVWNNHPIGTIEAGHMTPNVSGHRFCANNLISNF